MSRTAPPSGWPPPAEARLGGATIALALLAGVLAAREFPLEHLAASLELAADVVAERLEQGAEVAERLRGAAVSVQAR